MRETRMTFAGERARCRAAADGRGLTIPSGQGFGPRQMAWEREVDCFPQFFRPECVPLENRCIGKGPPARPVWSLEQERWGWRGGLVLF